MKRKYGIGLLLLIGLSFFVYLRFARVTEQKTKPRATTESLKNIGPELRNSDMGELKKIHWQFADQFEENEPSSLDSSKRT